MNPYASYLGTQSSLAVIEKTAGRLKQLMDQIGSDRVDLSPAPGKWSPREILCHLADTEVTFAFRIRQTLAEPNHVIQPFDQEKWGAQYKAYSAGMAVSTFASVRAWNIALVSSLAPEAMDTPVTHPERGSMTLRVIIETMAGHDVNHLQQLEKLAPQVASAS
jgi:hypothetical protein